MSSKTQRVIGWVLSGLLAAFLLFSASGKLTQLMPADQKQEMFSKLGWQEDTMKVIGVIEVAIVVLILIPRTAFIGAILLTGYLGGAVATHVRIGDPAFECSFPVGLGILAWVALGLRQPEVFRLAFGTTKS